MTDYQAGRTAGVFNVGSKVEDLKATYEQEAASFEAMKTAFGMGTRALLEFIVTTDRQMKEGKLPLKEAEVGKLYIDQCVEVLKKLFNDAEAKKLQAEGAIKAIDAVVASIKRVYDEENSKLLLHKEYEESETKILTSRPLGVAPELLKDGQEYLRTPNDRSKKQKRSKLSKDDK